MNAAVLKRLLCLPVLALLMAAKPLVDPAPVQAPAVLSAKEIMGSLRGTLVGRGWIIDKDGPNEIVATLHVRTHALTVRFTQNDHTISMNYVDSVNFDYRVRSDGTRMVHRKYTGWMLNLTNAMAQDFQRAAYAKTPN